jgi:hypothetical protein
VSGLDDGSWAAAALTREAERVADRLRVVGPRLAARGTPEARGVVTQVRELLQRLADLGADGEGEPRREVPALAEHALADQLLVLARDVASRANAEIMDAAARELAALRQTL